MQRRAPFLEFRTWKEHILSVFALELDSAGNAIHLAPNDTAPRVTYPGRAVRYHPTGGNGEWVRIEWGDAAPSSGWVRWKRDGHLVVRFFYFA